MSCGVVRAVDIYRGRHLRRFRCLRRGDGGAGEDDHHPPDERHPGQPAHQSSHVYAQVLSSSEVKTGRTLSVALVALGLGLVACGGDDDGNADTESPSSSSPSSSQVAGELVVTDVATNLDTVWSLAWDDDGKLWYTERGGRLTQLGGRSVSIDGVAENGEAGLMGLEFGPDGATYLMYSRRATTASSASPTTGARRCWSTASRWPASTTAAGSLRPRRAHSIRVPATPVTATRPSATGATARSSA